MKVISGSATRGIEMDLLTGKTRAVFKCAGTFEDGSTFNATVDAVEAEASASPGLFIKRQIEDAA